MVYDEVRALHCAQMSVRPSDLKECRGRAVCECAPWTLYHGEGASLLSLSLVYFCCKATTHKIILLISCPATAQGTQRIHTKFKIRSQLTQVQSEPAPRGHARFDGLLRTE